MLSSEELQDAYNKGWSEGYKKVEGESFAEARARADTAGFVAVVRLQAEHDAQIAESFYDGDPGGNRVEESIAEAILNQFEQEGATGSGS